MLERMTAGQKERIRVETERFQTEYRRERQMSPIAWDWGHDATVMPGTHVPTTTCGIQR